MDIIRIGTKQFARLPPDGAHSPPSNTDGYYTRNEGGILFFDAEREPFAQLVANAHGERFFVSASRRQDGRMWYMHALSTEDHARLGLPASWLAEHDIAESLVPKPRKPLPSGNLDTAPVEGTVTPSMTM